MANETRKDIYKKEEEIYISEEYRQKEDQKNMKEYNLKKAKADKRINLQW